MKSMERIGILGGVRIPFARQNTQYVNSSNLDMLTAVLSAWCSATGCKANASARSRPAPCSNTRGISI